MLEAVIVAGGLGVRLRPFTYMVPKPLLPLGKHTVIEHSIKNLARSGFRRIYILTSFQSKKFRQCMKYQKRHGVKISLFSEEEMMGTFGGLHLLKEKIKGDFMLVNGDIITTIDFSDVYRFHRRSGALLTLVAKSHAFRNPYGVVRFDRGKNLLSIKEKPVSVCPINTGIYVVSKKVIQTLTGGRRDITEMIQQLLKQRKRIKVYETGNEWLDIGKAEDYEQAVDIINSWTGPGEGLSNE